MQAVSFARVLIQIFSIATLLTAIALTIVAVVRTDWQTLDIQPFNLRHEHGLWRDCWKSTIPVQAGNEPHKWTCTYKFNQDDPEDHSGHAHGPNGHRHGNGAVGGAASPSGDDLQHGNLEWHRTVSSLFIAAASIGLLAVLFSFCGFALKICAIVWTLLSFVATSCAAAAIIIYFRNSHDKNIRFVEYLGKIYEQQVGTAFWYGVACVFVYLVAAILSVLTTVLFVLIQRRNNNSKLPPPHVVYSHGANNNSNIKPVTGKWPPNTTV